MKEAKEGNSRVLVPVQNAEDRLLELWIQSPHTPVTQAEVGKDTVGWEELVQLALMLGRMKRSGLIDAGSANSTAWALARTYFRSLLLL